MTIEGAADAGPALQVLLNAAAAELHPQWLEDPRVEERIRERLRARRRARRATRRAAARRRPPLARGGSRAVFEDVDVLVCPTTPFPAPPIDDAIAVEVSRAINRCNAPWSLAQLPAISIPLPMRERLPVGGQLVAPAGGDWLLVELAERVQTARRP